MRLLTSSPTLEGFGEGDGFEYGFGLVDGFLVFAVGSGIVKGSVNEIAMFFRSPTSLLLTRHDDRVASLLFICHSH